ncbi:MAG: type II secretion system F family protein, partial [Planctomycetes bacterium]|nr:type II secretion system F family protein [Planctomycetota bacterium]
MIGAVGVALIGVLIIWLVREICGDEPPPRQPLLGGDTSTSGIYRGLAGTGSSTEIDRDREQIEPELRRAGYYRPTALAEYKSVRALLIIMPLVVAAGIALVIDRPRVPSVFVGGLILAGLGYSVPRLYVNMVARYRKREIERGLPVAVDMLVLGLMAGQNIMNAFARVAREVRRAYPVLAEEMALTYRQAELNTLGHSLRVWAVRSGVNEVYNLAVILSQSERQGADVATSLLEFSANFRIDLRQRADAQANRASFWMLFPTLLCMWIPAIVVLVAPVAMQFEDRRNAARDAAVPPGVDKNEKNLQKRYDRFLKGQ